MAALIPLTWQRNTTIGDLASNFQIDIKASLFKAAVINVLSSPYSESFISPLYIPIQAIVDYAFTALVTKMAQEGSSDPHEWSRPFKILYLAAHFTFVALVSRKIVGISSSHTSLIKLLGIDLISAIVWQGIKKMYLHYEGGRSLATVAKNEKNQEELHKGKAEQTDSYLNPLADNWEVIAKDYLKIAACYPSSLRASFLEKANQAFNMATRIRPGVFFDETRSKLRKVLTQEGIQYKPNEDWKFSYGAC